MEKYVIDKTTLTGIGDAIREKEGTTEVIPVNNMKARIQAIDTQEDLDAELATQDDLIAQIMTELEGKAAAAPAELPTVKVNVNVSDGGYAIYCNAEGELCRSEESLGLVDVLNGYVFAYYKFNYGESGVFEKNEVATYEYIYKFLQDGGTVSGGNSPV